MRALPPGGECRQSSTRHCRHGEARPRARGFPRASSPVHRAPSNPRRWPGPHRPPSTRRCASWPVRRAWDQCEGRGLAWSHLLAPGTSLPAANAVSDGRGLWWLMTGIPWREERQETRGWTAVGGAVDPPVLLALSGAPGLRTVPRARPDVTSRQHTIRLVRAFQGLRGARGVSIWWTPHGCFSQQRRRRTAPGCATRPHIQSENARPSARLLIRQHVAPGTSSGGPPAPAPVPGPSRIAVRPARRSP